MKTYTCYMDQQCLQYVEYYENLHLLHGSTVNCENLHLLHGSTVNCENLHLLHGSTVSTICGIL